MKRALVLSMLWAASCGSGGGGEGGSTPQDTFNQAQSSAQKGDWKTAFGMMDPEARDKVLLGMMMGAGFATMGDANADKDLKTLLEKHGVKEARPSPAADPNAAAQEAFKDVKDKAALFADLASFLEKHGQAEQMRKDNDATVKDIKIDGDKATGTLVKKDGSTNDIKFVRRNGRWYLGTE